MESHLEAFQHSVEEGHTAGSTLANSMLVLMVRGLFSQLQFPYAQFPCTALSGHQLYELFWDAVGRLEGCGFMVLALTCDGLAANCRLFKLHSPDDRSYPQGCQSLCQWWQIPVLFSDPPHLVKTVRNAWANKKQLLWVSICVVLLPLPVIFPLILTIGQRTEDFLVTPHPAVLRALLATEHYSRADFTP